MAVVDVSVKVVLHAPNVDPPYHFETTDLPMGPDNVLYFRNCKKNDWFRISYNLDDTANPGYRFPPGQGPVQLQNALWVQQGFGCPQSQSSWTQFKPHSVTNNGGTLVVDNMNQNQQDFSYTLRVVKTVDGNEHWLDLDPGGVNRNGGSGAMTLFSATNVLFFLAGVAITAAYFVFAMN